MHTEGMKTFVKQACKYIDMPVPGSKKKKNNNTGLVLSK